MIMAKTILLMFSGMNHISSAGTPDTGPNHQSMVWTGTRGTDTTAGYNNQATLSSGAYSNTIQPNVSKAAPTPSLLTPTTGRDNCFWLLNQREYRTI